MDAAKAAWFLFERPDIPLEAINPLEEFGLRSKARLITIPTTAGSGSEVTQASLIKDHASRRKLELACYEMVADVAVVDPSLSAGMPAQLTADAGIDVLSHAVEVYTGVWESDFLDALALQATRLVFNYLPRAVANGGSDMEARQKMANAATMAGLCICNSNIALAHAMGHSMVAIFPIPHGRVTAIFLPYTIEFVGRKCAERYAELASAAGFPPDDGHPAPRLANAVRGLMQQIGLPVSLREAGVDREGFAAELDELCEKAEMDLGMMFTRRAPDRDELKRLFQSAYEGRAVDY
jgi:acetaldehyde dehydrogenase/alcohol dehydrogenase